MNIVIKFQFRKDGKFLGRSSYCKRVIKNSPASSYSPCIRYDTEHVVTVIMTYTCYLQLITGDDTYVSRHCIGESRQGMKYSAH